MGALNVTNDDAPINEMIFGAKQPQRYRPR
jgi:hypothetical protein